MKRCVLIYALAGSMWGAVLAQDSATVTNANTEVSTNSIAPLKIPAVEAKQHINSDVLITGRVAEVNKAERLVRLNFERPYPNQAFTAVIFANRTNLFPDVDLLKDRIVEIGGKLTEYRGRPEIILTSTNQLKVVEQPKPAQGKTCSVDLLSCDCATAGVRAASRGMVGRVVRRAPRRVTGTGFQIGLPDCWARRVEDNAPCRGMAERAPPIPETPEESLMMFDFYYANTLYSKHFVKPPASTVAST